MNQFANVALSVGAAIPYGAAAILVPTDTGLGRVLQYQQNNSGVRAVARPGPSELAYAQVYFASPGGQREPGQYVQRGDTVAVVFPLCGTTSTATHRALTATGSNGASVTTDEFSVSRKDQQWVISKNPSLSPVIHYGETVQLASVAYSGQFLTVDVGTTPGIVSVGSPPSAQSISSAFVLFGPQMTIPAPSAQMPINGPSCPPNGDGSAKFQQLLWWVMGALVLLLLFLWV